jgi:hypothetical protein
MVPRPRTCCVAAGGPNAVRCYEDKGRLFTLGGRMSYPAPISKLAASRSNAVGRATPASRHRRMISAHSAGLDDDVSTSRS